MAVVDDLVSQVPDRILRERLQKAVGDLRKRKKFGLVFEEHIPETAAVYGLPLQPGMLVQRRQDLDAKQLFRIVHLDPNGKEATIANGQGPGERIASRDLLAIKRFGEPMYATLTPIGAVRRGIKDAPHHAVINGENFHALQLFAYIYEGAVDCIYIDPPYNTGARDWKYNNRYVDENDSWRHSKWLAMMEKRLRLARRLLRADGVLICTADEHEVHHLGMLLENLFSDYFRYMITVVHNPKGTFKANFARVEEYAFFCCPSGREVITPLPEGLFVQVKRPDQLDKALSSGDEYLYLRRRGQESGYRKKRPNQFYAILVDEERREVVGVGPALGRDAAYRVQRRGSVVTVYPLDTRGQERVWRYNRETMEDLIAKGEIVVTGFSKKTPQGWILNHRKTQRATKRLKTVWWEKRHDAGGHGSDLLTEYLGQPGLFPFPKSVYAVRDCLDAVVRNRPTALVLDFFAGSGTTLHAVCLLNAADGGTRRCILVTNNEVEEGMARSLATSGHYPGDPEYERRGIFEAVTKPRAQAVITGRRPDGEPVRGKHVWAGGRPYAEGFNENVEFFKLGYMDPDAVVLGEQFEAILPALWLAAGGIGPRSEIDISSGDFVLAKDSPFAVLFKVSRLRRFLKELKDRPDVTHVWIVTDSEEAYGEACEAMPSHVTRTSQLYRDYLKAFKVNMGTH